MGFSFGFVFKKEMVLYKLFKIYECFFFFKMKVIKLNNFKFLFKYKYYSFLIKNYNICNIWFYNYEYICREYGIEFLKIDCILNILVFIVDYFGLRYMFFFCIENVFICFFINN